MGNFQRIQVQRRRFGVRIGELMVGIKEYKSELTPTPTKGLSFLLTSQGEFQPDSWGQVDRQAIRREILRRIA